MKNRIVVGIHSCKETILVRPKAIRSVVLKVGYEKSSDLLEFANWAKSNRVPMQAISLQKLDQMSHGHQGVAIEVSQSPTIDWASLDRKEKSMLLVLDGIEDPQNLGAVLRSTWLLGVDGILIPKDRSVGLTPTACKIASGGAEHVAVEEVNIASSLTLLREKGFWIFGLSEKAKSNIWKLKIPNKVVWVVGSEGAGMRAQTQKLCDELVTIPQVSAGPSFNASVAAAITLAETRRQLFWA